MLRMKILALSGILLAGILSQRGFSQPANSPAATAEKPDGSEAGKPTLYIFSGLGADERIFGRLNFNEFRPVFIQWVPPLEAEDMQAYARRIAGQIAEPEPMLLGVSFGGMMAIEVAKWKPCKKIVIVSSAKTGAELAASDNLFLRWKLYHKIPSSVLGSANFFVNRLFGVENKEDRALLRSILADTDIRFFRWAMDQMLQWDNQLIPERLLHIHGGRDRIIPLTNLHPDITIPDAGHFMIWNRAGLLQAYITEYLNRNE
jgi:pimeloyl-ACP methyl ester carboxylesterase